MFCNFGALIHNLGAGTCKDGIDTARKAMPSSQIRFNDGHLIQLASKARNTDSRSGWVLKKPGTSDGGSRWQRRWLQLYQNYLFYFESDKAPRPLGVVLLELCECRRVFRRLQDAPPVSTAATAVSGFVHLKIKANKQGIH